jgi:hypothetical protein
MGPPQGAARRHINTDLEEVAAGRCGGFKKREALAAKRMHDRFPDLSAEALSQCAIAWLVLMRWGFVDVRRTGGGQRMCPDAEVELHEIAIALLLTRRRNANGPHRLGRMR